MSASPSRKSYIHPGHGAGYWLIFARSAFLILLSFELVIRLFILKHSPVEYKPGWGIIHVRDSYSVHGLEGFAVTHYLDNGEIVTPYQDGISVVVLGDSTTKAAQIPNDSNYVSLTEIALRTRGIHADLHNLGLPDRSIADYVALGPYVQKEYAPEIVVLQVNPSQFFFARAENRPNHFVDAGNGVLKLVTDQPDQVHNLAFTNFISHSGLLTLLDFRARNLLISHSPGQNGTDLAGEGQPIPEIERPSKNKDPQLALRQYGEEILPQIKALQAAYPNSKLVFLVIPYTPTFPSSLDDKIGWISPDDHLLARTLFFMDDVYMIYTLDAFQDLYVSEYNLPRGTWNSAFNFGHLNSHGHAAVASELVKMLGNILSYTEENDETGK